MAPSPSAQNAAPVDENAKLSSLFNKKKKKTMKSKKITTNDLAGGPASASSGSSNNSNSPSSKPAKSPASSTSGSPAKGPLVGTTKTLADLSLNEKEASEPQKGNFQWAKQPKKFKDTSKDGVAKTWLEHQERNRKINLDSERAFPTLGADANAIQLQNMKAVEPKSVTTNNVWSTLEENDD